MVHPPTGYQVVKVTKLPDYMPPAKAVNPKLAKKPLPEEVEAIRAHEAKCKPLHSMLSGGGSPTTLRPCSR